jgi:hypothetical protein
MSAVAMEEDVPVSQEVVSVSFLAGAVKERLEEFVGGVALASMDHPVQRENAERYVRGLLQAGPRKSLEPLEERLAGEADCQSLQQFLADSPWDPERVIQAVVERVAPVVEASTRLKRCSGRCPGGHSDGSCAYVHLSGWQLPCPSAPSQPADRIGRITTLARTPLIDSIITDVTDIGLANLREVRRRAR